MYCYVGTVVFGQPSAIDERWLRTSVLELSWHGSIQPVNMGRQRTQYLEPRSDFVRDGFFNGDEEEGALTLIGARHALVLFLSRDSGSPCTWGRPTC